MSETMTTTSDRVFAAKQPNNAKSLVMQFLLVQGINFRCVAFCDQQGRWRDAFNREELFGDIHILPRQ